MRKFLTLLLVLGLTLPSTAGMRVKRGAGIATAAGAYDDILLWVNFERGATATSPYSLTTGEYSAGASTGTLAADPRTTPAPLVEVSAACTYPTNGSYGLHVSSDAAPTEEYITFVVSSDDIIKPTTGHVGFWLNFTTMTTRTLFQYGGGTGRLIIYQLSGNIAAEYYDGTVTSTAFTSGASITTGNWYFVDVAWNATANTLTAQVTDSGGSSVSNTDSTTNFAPLTGATSILFGTRGGVQEQCMDQLMVSNDSARDLKALRNNSVSPR